ncbi:MAG TPA: hypothetical protein PK495_02195, partial [Bacteroidales bacterium]|nr:hypothetical protein [Bacteroidales bacterium]
MKIEDILTTYRQSAITKHLSGELKKLKVNNLQINGLLGGAKAFVVKSCVEMSVDMHLLVFA